MTYNPYDIKLSDIWEYVAHINRVHNKPTAFESESVKGMFLALKREIREMGLGKKLVH